MLVAPRQPLECGRQAPRVGAVYFPVPFTGGELSRHVVQGSAAARREDAGQQPGLRHEFGLHLWRAGVQQRLVEIDDLARLRGALMPAWMSHGRR